MLPTPRTHRRGWGWALLSMGVALTSFTMWVHGVDIGTQLRFGVVSMVTIVAPGFALSTWAGKSPWPARLSIAWAVGLPVQLLGWASAVTFGFTPLTWVVPLLVASGASVIWRRRLQEEFFVPRETLGTWAAITGLGLWIVALGRFAESWVANPKQAGSWYQDLYWHLAINATARSRVPLLDPQAVDEPFSYHWLTNAHIGGVALAGGIDVRTIFAVGWSVPAFAAALGLAFGLTHYLTQRGWAGTMAAALVTFPPAFTLDAALAGGTTANFLPLSPSHMLALPVTLALIWSVVVILRQPGPRSRAALPALAALLLTAPGVKISILLVILGGLILALGCAVVTHRNVRRIAVLTVAAVVVAALSMPIFGGGGGGSRLQILGGAQQRPVYRASAEGLAAAGQLTAVFVLLAFAALILLNHLWWTPALAGFSPRDPVSWFFIGTLGAALGVTQVLVHPGQSQLYFAFGIQPLAAVAVAVGLRRIVDWESALPGSPSLSRRLVPIALSGLALGSVVAGAVRIDRLNVPSVVIPLLLTAGGAAFSILVYRRDGRPAIAAMAAFLVAFSAGAPLIGALSGARYTALAQRSTPPTEPPPYALTTDELTAMRWMAENLPTDAVVATNLHCRNVRTEENCEARGFWVAALGERQVFLGGWAYTAFGRSTEGIGGVYHVLQPYPDTRTFQLNESAFYATTQGTLNDLADRGVTHLAAIARAGDVSPQLPQWCSVLYANDDVMICQIDDDQ